MGFAYVDFNNEELICEFVATINDFRILIHIKLLTKFQFSATPPALVGVKDLIKIKVIGIIMKTNTTSMYGNIRKKFFRP